MLPGGKQDCAINDSRADDSASPLAEGWTAVDFRTQAPASQATEKAESPGG